jgi:hypothetical protein
LCFGTGAGTDPARTPDFAASQTCALDQVVKDLTIISEITNASICYRK